MTNLKNLLKEAEEAFEKTFPSDPYGDVKSGEKVVAYSIDSKAAKKFVLFIVKKFYHQGIKDERKRLIKKIEKWGTENVTNNFNQEGVFTLNYGEFYKLLKLLEEGKRVRG